MSSPCSSAGATGLFFQTPSQHLPSLFHLCTGNVPPVVEEGAQPCLLCCALCLCSAPVHLNSLSQIIFVTNWCLGPLLCTESPLQSKGRMGTLSSGEECPSPPAAAEAAGRSWSYTSGWPSSFWMPGLLHSPAAVRGPLSALRGGSGQGAAGPHPGVVSEQPQCERIDTASDNRCFPPLLPRPACPRLCREVKPDTKSLADVLWSPFKQTRTAGGGVSPALLEPPCGGGPRALHQQDPGSLRALDEHSGANPVVGVGVELSTHPLQRGSIPLSSVHGLLKSWGAPLGPWSSLPPLAEH